MKNEKVKLTKRILHLASLTDSNDHQHGWDTKGENVALLAETVQLPEPWRQERRNHGAKIDAGVKYSKKCGYLPLLLWNSELLGTEGHDARLDSSGAKRDEDESKTRYRSTARL